MYENLNDTIASLKTNVCDIMSEVMTKKAHDNEVKVLKEDFELKLKEMNREFNQKLYEKEQTYKASLECKQTLINSLENKLSEETKKLNHYLKHKDKLYTSVILDTLGDYIINFEFIDENLNFQHYKFKVADTISDKGIQVVLNKVKLENKNFKIYKIILKLKDTFCNEWKEIYMVDLKNFNHIKIK